MVNGRPDQSTPPPANASMGQPADISQALEVLKILGYLNPMTAPMTAGIDTLSGGNPLGSLAGEVSSGLGLNPGQEGSQTNYGMNPWGPGGALNERDPNAPPTQNPWGAGGIFGEHQPPQDVGPHPNPTGTGSPGGTGLDAGALIPDASAVAALAPEYGGGESTPAPTPPPTGDPNMPTPSPNLPGALEQVGAAGRDMRTEGIDGIPGAQRVGEAITYTIQPGDSLSLIGAMFGLTYDELIAGNEGMLGEKGKATVIHPGQTILVSPPPGRGTKAREGVRDKGFETAEEGIEFSKANRPGQQARARAARG